MFSHLVDMLRLRDIAKVYYGVKDFRIKVLHYIIQGKLLKGSWAAVLLVGSILVKE